MIGPFEYEVSAWRPLIGQTRVCIRALCPVPVTALAMIRVIIVFGFVECRTLVVPGVSGGCYLSAAYNGAVVAEGITGFWSAFS